jgi:non-ribosomal peptide synthetase component F
MTRTFQFLAHTFNASIYEMLMSLVFGDCVCIPSDHDRLNDTAGVLTRLRANLAILTPSLVQTFGDADLLSLQTLCLDGEPVDEAPVQRWAPYLNLLVGYGPTDCAISSTFARREADDGYPARNVGCGTGCRTWVVDRANYYRLVPVGCVGERVIDGPIVARGYLGDEATTAKSFIAAPAWAAGYGPGGAAAGASNRRVYKTGDLV